MTAPDATAPLRDPQGRGFDTLRLAITDRCNLRCRYCMPPGGVEAATRPAVLRYEEMRRLAGLLCSRGIRRIRVTGGEPLMRRGATRFLAALADLPSAPEILLTTNGVLLRGRLGEVRDAGVKRINLSLDSLDRATYRELTGCDGLEAVLPLLESIPAAGLGLKVNVVVQPGVNDGELSAFAALARDRDLEVRFIEPMPLAGDGAAPFEPFPGERILERLAGDFVLEPLPTPAGAVAELYSAPGWRGRLGVIRGHSRTFCGACSRLRVDARGRLRTCLYAAPAADLGGLMRAGATDEELDGAVRAALAGRHADGFAAERARGAAASMVDIGG